MKDNRFGVPSASSAWRTENCLGWLKAANGHESATSQYAEDGTAIALALEHGPNSDQWEALTAAQVQTATLCWHQTLSVIHRWLGEEDECVDVNQHWWEIGRKEVRLGLTVLGKVIDAPPESRAKFVGTGKPDFYVVSKGEGAKALVIDHKSGRGEVLPSNVNPQLRMNAVLVWLRHPEVVEVTVAIIQPLTGKPVIAVFDNEALVLAKEWLDGVLAAEKAATAKDRCAGDWCLYCPYAELGCPTLNAKSLEVVAPLKLNDIKTEKKKEAIFARVMEVSAQTLMEMDEQRKMMEVAMSAVTAAIRMRLEQGDPVICENYRLTDGRKTRKITDAAAAFEALQPLGVTLEDFWAAVDPTLGPLEAAIRIRSGKRTKKDGGESSHYNLSVDEASKKLTEVLLAAGALEYKQSQPQLERITNEIE